jgi:hypothetical protein
MINIEWWHVLHFRREDFRSDWQSPPEVHVLAQLRQVPPQAVIRGYLPPLQWHKLATCPILVLSPNLNISMNFLFTHTAYEILYSFENTMYIHA